MPINLQAFTPVQVVVAGKSYTYKWPDSISADTGDFPEPRSRVVVPFGKQGLVVGIVESVGQLPLDPNAKFQYKWVAAKLDLTVYDAILAAEAAAAGSTSPAPGAPVDPMAAFRRS